MDEIKQHSQDRIVVLDFTSKDGPRRLVCELTGKTANILMVDRDQHILRDLNRQRQIIGQQYQPPLKHTSAPVQDTASRFTAMPGPGRFPFSAAIEAHYHNKETSLVQDRARNERLHTLRKTLKKGQRRIEAWRDDLAKATKYRDYARYGELIKANLGSIKTGMNRISLVDYYDEALPQVTLPLDSTKSAQGNMDDYFKKHRKYLAAERELKPRIAQAEGAAEPPPSVAPGSDLALILWDMAQAEHLEESSALASRIQEELAVVTGSEGRGVKQAPFRVLVGASMPAVLVGIAFISNPEEEKLLTSDAYQAKIAAAVARGIQRSRRDRP